MSDETAVYVIKTTANQERPVANLLEQVAKKRGHDIRAILVPDELKGYVLIESPAPEIVEQAIQGIPHVRGMVKGKTNYVDRGRAFLDTQADGHWHNRRLHR